MSRSATAVRSNSHSAPESGSKAIVRQPRSRAAASAASVSGWSPKRHRDVLALGLQRDLVGHGAALAGDRQRGQRALADDHRVDELDRDVARVGAVGGRGAERHEPALAREALGHLVAQAREALGLRPRRTRALASPRARSSASTRSAPIVSVGLTSGRWVCGGPLGACFMPWRARGRRGRACGCAARARDRGRRARDRDREPPRPRSAPAAPSARRGTRRRPRRSSR